MFLEQQLSILLKNAIINRYHVVKPAYDSFSEKKEFTRIGDNSNEIKKNAEIQKAKRDQAQIIIDLIKLDPCHLDEPWIAREIIRWARLADTIPWLQEAIISQSGRNRPTANQFFKTVKDFFLFEKVKKLQKENGWSLADVFRQIALNESEENSAEQLELMIKKRYYAFKKNHEEEPLKFPYYGRDIFFSHETGEIIIEGFNCKVEMNGIILFGDYNYKLPQIKPSIYDDLNLYKQHLVKDFLKNSPE